jgi:NADH-dependent peroxiredoxin subunit F
MSLSFSLHTQTQVTLETSYDFVSIGGGPAGFNAALYAQRKGLKTLLIAARPGGQLLNTSSVDNYLGITDLSGEALYENFQAHLKSLNIDQINETKVEALWKDETNAMFYLQLSDGREIQAKTVMVATGSNPRKLDIPGEAEFANAGVAYCAICDAPLFIGKDVIIAGGGNSAVEAAIDVAKLARKVTLVHRSQLRADQILIDRMRQASNIEVYLESQIQRIYGDTRMRGIEVLDKATQDIFKLEADGIFIEIGNIPNSSLIQDLVETNAFKEVIVDERQRTSLEGLFAAGDVTQTAYKQIIIAAADGAKAALAASEYINTH